MRKSLLVAGVVGWVGLAACGGEKSRPGVAPEGTDDGGEPSKGGTRATSGGSSSTGGLTHVGDGGMGDGGGAPSTDPPKNAPVVEVTSPKASAEPKDGVITEQVVRATCEVTRSTEPGATEVDPTTVRLSMLDAKGKAIAEKDASSTGVGGAYEADFVVTMVPTGRISFQCSASDKKGIEGRDEVTTFVDHGPEITVLSPLPDSAHAQKGGLAVQFKVAAVPLTADDAEADVDEVTFTLDGKPFDLDASGNTYTASIALDDTDLFPTVPAGSITIKATNSRTPSPATANTSYGILVDGLGPTVTIQKPAPQAVVGGQVQVEFTVTDAGSGVDPASVNVTLYAGQSKIFYDPTKGWSKNGDKFVFSFDSKEVEKFAPIQTTINIRANDKVGNPSATGQSVQIYLDNAPPQVDLDPQNIRTVSATSCSGSFDPVGDASANDLDGTPGRRALSRFGWFRAFVSERGNYEPGQSIVWLSGTNQKEVRVYYQADPENAATKLLVSKNAGVDSTCDDIGGIDDLQNGPPFSGMTPPSTTGPMGTPWNKVDPDATPTAPGSCTLTAGAQPDWLCPTHTSNMFYVPFNQQLKEPYVYVVGTPNMQDASCTGIDLNFLRTGQPEGWVCVAARAVDNAGNVGISPPLRLCADDPTTPEHPACAVSSTVPPSCTDGCTPPARGGGFALVP
jgi:hypothetical protein